MSRQKTNKSSVLYTEVIPKTEGQEDYFDSINENRITIAEGPAGSGKTLISCYLAMKMVTEGRLQKIIITRPAKEACQEKLGFMPGDLMDKMNGYVIPVLYNFSKLVGSVMLETMLRSKDIEVVPLAFMRGRDFDKSFVLVEEAQNCNLDQFKMILTRITDRSKIVISGDSDQSDIANDNVLTKVGKSLEGLPSYKFVRLTKHDIVRSKYITEIIERLETV